MTGRRDTAAIAGTTIQANIGRRRSTRLAALARTPPRASGSEQMGNVFVQSVPKIGKRLAWTSSERQPGSDKTKTAFWRDRCDSIQPSQEPDVASSREGTISSGIDDEDPLGDLERAAALESSSSAKHSSSPPQDRPATANPGNVPTTSHVSEDRHVSPPRTPAAKTEKSSSVATSPGCKFRDSVKSYSKQSTCSTSSEEWTGDEEFLPLSVRQRHQAQRQAFRQALTSPPQASLFNAHTHAGLDWDTVRELQQALSHENSIKTSRFRKPGRVGGVREAEVLQEQKESQADNDFVDEGEIIV